MGKTSLNITPQKVVYMSTKYIPSKSKISCIWAVCIISQYCIQSLSTVKLKSYYATTVQEHNVLFKLTLQSTLRNLYAIVNRGETKLLGVLTNTYPNFVDSEPFVNDISNHILPLYINQTEDCAQNPPVSQESELNMHSSFLVHLN